MGQTGHPPGRDTTGTCPVWKVTLEKWKVSTCKSLILRLQVESKTEKWKVQKNNPCKFNNLKPSTVPLIAFTVHWRPRINDLGRLTVPLIELTVLTLRQLGYTPLSQSKLAENAY